MNFTIIITAAPHSSQASITAYRFTAAALQKGHKIERVYFYHDGVHNATDLSTPPQDEPDIIARWAKLAELHNLNLTVCTTAAQRRGILDAATQQRNQKPANNIHPAFRLGGLGKLIESAITSDRLITFH